MTRRTYLRRLVKCWSIGSRIRRVRKVRYMRLMVKLYMVWKSMDSFPIDGLGSLHCFGIPTSNGKQTIVTGYPIQLLRLLTDDFMAKHALLNRGNSCCLSRRDVAVTEHTVHPANVNVTRVRKGDRLYRWFPQSKNGKGKREPSSPDKSRAQYDHAKCQGDHNGNNNFSCTAHNPVITPVQLLLRICAPHLDQETLGYPFRETIEHIWSQGHRPYLAASVMPGTLPRLQI